MFFAADQIHRPSLGGTIFVTADARDLCRIDIRPVVYFLLDYQLIVGRKNIFAKKCSPAKIGRGVE